MFAFFREPCKNVVFVLWNCGLLQRWEASLLVCTLWIDNSSCIYNAFLLISCWKMLNAFQWHSKDFPDLTSILMPALHCIFKPKQNTPPRYDNILCSVMSHRINVALNYIFSMNSLNNIFIHTPVSCIRQSSHNIVHAYVFWRAHILTIVVCLEYLIMLYHPYHKISVWKD